MDLKRFKMFDRGTNPVEEHDRMEAYLRFSMKQGRPSRARIAFRKDVAEGFVSLMGDRYKLGIDAFTGEMVLVPDDVGFKVACHGKGSASMRSWMWTPKEALGDLCDAFYSRGVESVPFTVEVGDGYVVLHSEDKE